MSTLRCARHFGQALLVLLAACSNGRGSLEGPESPPTQGAQDGFSVGGTISGLTGSGLILQNNGGGDLSIAADGAFTFAGRLAAGASYNVAVLSQPTGPAQTCAVSAGSGSIASSNVTNVVITCATGQFSVGGSVSGVTGTGLVLQNNGGDDVSMATNGSFTFASRLADGATYNVTVKAQPSGQGCVVRNASGTIAGANVGNVDVSCGSDQFTVGGTVTGLSGSGLVLQLNGGTDLDIASDGSFTFEDGLSSGTAYRVSVARQPSNPAQICTVAAANGTIGSANVTNVRVSCASNTFSIGGTVNGLLGSGLVLQNNGGDDLAVNSNGSFTFETALASGATYNVRVRTQPSGPAQSCSVTNGRGTVGTANVTRVVVSCNTSDFTIGGTVSGLSGSGLILRNNDGDELTINDNGGFTFDTALPAGARYNVTIAGQPTNPGQTCTVSNGTGFVLLGNVTNVTVRCETAGFLVGGRVRSLSGSGLVLQNNGGDDLAIASSGRFEFSTPLASGAPYNVTVARQPSGPQQTCNVKDGAGTVRDSNVRNVEVRCENDD